MSFKTQKNKILNYYEDSKNNEEEINKLKRKEFLLQSNNFHKKKQTITLLEDYFYDSTAWLYGVFVYEYKIDFLKEWMLSSIFVNFYVTGKSAPGFEVSNLYFYPGFDYLWKMINSNGDNEENSYILKMRYNGQLVTTSPTQYWPLYLNLKLITYNPLVYYALSNNKT